MPIFVDGSNYSWGYGRNWKSVSKKSPYCFEIRRNMYTFAVAKNKTESITLPQKEMETNLGKGDERTG